MKKPKNKTKNLAQNPVNYVGICWDLGERRKNRVPTGDREKKKSPTAMVDVLIGEILNQLTLFDSQ